VGRPIGHIKPNIDCPDLEDQISRVVDTVTPHEQEVRDRQGNLYSLRIRPYKNVDNRIEGAVLALFDLQQDRAQENAVRRAHDYAERVRNAARQPLVVLDPSLRVEAVNAAFCETFATTSQEAEGRALAELDGTWATPRLRAMLADVAESG